MLTQLLDIAPIPRHYRDIPVVPRDTEVVDTIAPVQEFAGQMGQSGSNTATLIGALLVALLALGICIFFVRNYRRQLPAIQ